MEISIILTVYQKEQVIERIVRSILENTIAPFQLIIVFDGCTDRSEELCMRYLKEQPIHDLKILHTPDVNEVIANNTGMKEADGKYWIIIQDDMEIKERGYEQRLLKPMKTWGDVFAVTAKTAHGIKIENNKHRGWVDEFKIYKTRERNKFIVRDIAVRGPLALDGEVVKELNYLDEAFAPINQDDHDLCLRAYLQLNKICGAYHVKWKQACLRQTSIGKSKDICRASTRKNMKLIVERYGNCKLNCHNEERLC